MAAVTKEVWARVRSWALSVSGLLTLIGTALIVAAIVGAYGEISPGILVVLFFLLGMGCIGAAIVGIETTADWLRRVGGLGVAAFFGFLGLFFLVLLPSVAINWSSEHLPRSLHIAILWLATLLLAGGFYLCSTERLRRRLLGWASGEDPVLLATIIIGLLVLTSARVLASFTFILYDNDLVDLTSNISGEAVAEGRLFDFYMWHFLDVVPFLSIPEITNLREPITYSSTWVGFLVLLFQGLWVLILIPTIRSFAQRGREPQRMGVMPMYKRALKKTGSIVSKVKPEQLGDRTPCDEWDVRALLNHIVAGNQRWATPFGGESNDLETLDLIGNDPGRAYRRSSRAALKGLSAPGLPDRAYSTPIGSVDGEFAPYVALTEITVHGWDLAKATGQDSTIEDDIATLALGTAKKAMVPPQLPRPRDGAFRDPVPVVHGSSPTDKLVAFLGRPPWFR